VERFIHARKQLNTCSQKYKNMSSNTTDTISFEYESGEEESNGAIQDTRVRKYIRDDIRRQKPYPTVSRRLSMEKKMTTTKKATMATSGSKKTLTLKQKIIRLFGHNYKRRSIHSSSSMRLSLINIIPGI